MAVVLNLIQNKLNYTCKLYEATFDAQVNFILINHLFKKMDYIFSHSSSGFPLFLPVPARGTDKR